MKLYKKIQALSEKIAKEASLIADVSQIAQGNKVLFPLRGWFADDDMIQDRNSQKMPAAHKIARRFDVHRAGHRVAGRMIMD